MSLKVIGYNLELAFLISSALQISAILFLNSVSPVAVHNSLPIW